MSTTQTTPEAAQVQDVLRMEDFMEKVTDATIRMEMERAVADKYQAFAVRRRPGCANPEEVQMRISAGRAFGLDRDTSLSCFDVIQGVVAMRATLRAALLQRHGWHWRFVKHDANECSMIATKDGEAYADASGQPHVFTYTMEDAKRAKLDAKDSWKTNPLDMLFARCITRLQRRVCPAATLGLDIPDTTEPVTIERIIDATEQRIADKTDAATMALRERLAAAQSMEVAQ